MANEQNVIRKPKFFPDGGVLRSREMLLFLVLSHSRVHKELELGVAWLAQGWHEIGASESLYRRNLWIIDENTPIIYNTRF